jgi:hypothetical protein
MQTESSLLMIGRNDDRFTAFAPEDRRGAPIAAPERLLIADLPLRLRLVASVARADGPGVLAGGTAFFDGLRCEVVSATARREPGLEGAPGRATTSLIAHGQRVPLRGGVARYDGTGDPWLSVDLLHGHLAPPGDAELLGRLSQAPPRRAANLVIAFNVLLCVAVRGAGPGGRTSIELSGKALSRGEASAWIGFHSGGGGGGEPRRAQYRRVPMLPGRTAVSIPRRFVHGAFDRNSPLSVRFLDRAGVPVGDDFQLGWAG